MKPIEPVLRAMRAQVQFAAAEAAADVSRAAMRVSSADRAVALAERTAGDAAHHASRATRHNPVNLPLVEALHRLYRAERGRLQEARGELSLADKNEQAARSVLSSLHSQDRSLERAIREERRKSQRARRRLEVMLADDLWLQRVVR